MTKLLDDSNEENKIQDESDKSSCSSKTSSSSSSSSRKSQQQRDKKHKKKKEAEVVDSSPKSTHLLSIPDTCVYDLQHRAVKPAPVPTRLSVIRDTIDNNEDDENMMIVDPFEKKTSKTKQKPRDFVPDTNMIEAKPHQLDVVINENHVNTPLAVKRQLQEHGLLDMTNSPGRTQLDQVSDTAANDRGGSSSCEPSPICKMPPLTPCASKKSNKAPTPVKVTSSFVFFLFPYFKDLGPLIFKKDWKKEKYEKTVGPRG